MILPAIGSTARSVIRCRAPWNWTMARARPTPTGEPTGTPGGVRCGAWSRDLPGCDRPAEEAVPGPAGAVGDVAGRPAGAPAPGAGAGATAAGAAAGRARAGAGAGRAGAGARGH